MSTILSFQLAINMKNCWEICIFFHINLQNPVCILYLQHIWIWTITFQAISSFCGYHIGQWNSGSFLAVPFSPCSQPTKEEQKSPEVYLFQASYCCLIKSLSNDWVTCNCRRQFKNLSQSQEHSSPPARPVQGGEGKSSGLDAMKEEETALNQVWLWERRRKSWTRGEESRGKRSDEGHCFPSGRYNEESVFLSPHNGPWGKYWIVPIL